MSEPGLLDIRRVAKGMKVYHMFEGERRLLSVLVTDGNNIHKGSGPWQAKSYCQVNLRWGNGCSRNWKIGSKRFNYVCKCSKNHQVLPKAIWLFLDMLHLIMLLAKRTNAKRDVVQFWFQEAKDFLSHMEM